MRATYSKQAVKVLERMDGVTKQRIREGVKKIPAGNIVPLKGAPGNFRLRIGDWRILFAYVEKERAYIKKISPRGQVYKGV